VEKKKGEATGQESLRMHVLGHWAKKQKQKSIGGKLNTAIGHFPLHCCRCLLLLLLLLLLLHEVIPSS